MTLSVDCIIEYGNLGAFCATKNPIQMINGIAIFAPNVQFDSPEDFADKAVWDTKIKAGEIHILKGVQEIDDNSIETKYYEAPSGDKTKTKDGVYVFNYKFLITTQQHKELQKYNGLEVGYMKFDVMSHILAWEDPNDGSVKPFTTKDFSTENMIIPSGSDSVAFSPVMVTEADRDEWNLHSVYVKPLWSPSTLKDLAPVEMIVSNPTATGFDMEVYYNAGKNRDGTIKKIGIGGLVTADVEFLDGAGDPQTIVIAETTPKGFYTVTGTALVSGTNSLVAPSLLSEGLLIIQVTPVVVTIV